MIALAGELASEWLQLPGDVNAVIDAIWSSARESLQDADQAKEALRVLFDHFSANREKYEPGKAYTMVASLGSRHDNIWATYIPAEFDTILADAFTPKVIRKMFKEKGWLECDADHVTKVVRVGKASQRRIVIKREALAAIDAEWSPDQRYEFPAPEPLDSMCKSAA